MSDAIITCPFCGETDFDLIGLKIHLTRVGTFTGDPFCKPFDDTPTGHPSIADSRESREQKATRLVKESGKAIHSSDCATSRAPAEEPGPCDCDAGELQNKHKSDWLEHHRHFRPSSDCHLCTQKTAKEKP